jgi:hypothetical protein
MELHWAEILGCNENAGGKVCRIQRAVLNCNVMVGDNFVGKTERRLT